MTTFDNWLDSILENAAFTGVIAFNFNLYEGENKTYHLELIGSNQYDPKDSDWACAEIFTTRENLYITNDVTGKEWQDTLIFFKNKVREYLENGKFRQKLLDKKAIGIGFVDGEIEILFKNANQ